MIRPRTTRRRTIPHSAGHDHSAGGATAAGDGGAHDHGNSSSSTSEHSHDPTLPADGGSASGHVHPIRRPAPRPSATRASASVRAAEHDARAAEWSDHLRRRSTPDAAAAAGGTRPDRPHEGRHAGFPDVAAVEAAGYASIGDGGTGYEHYVKWAYLTDGVELDANRIESIVVRHNGDGTKTVASAMYILALGKTMANVPDIAGPLTTWHDHQNLCWQGLKVVGTTVNGVCTQGVFMATPPMLHVWMVDNPCGPFAGIDDHGGACVVHGH